MRQAGVRPGNLSLAIALKSKRLPAFPSGRRGDGGARRDRTDDLMLAKHALYQLSYGPFKGPFFSALERAVDLSARGVTRSVVGPGRLELPTSRLSGVCSNQLSYRPLKRSASEGSPPEYAIAPQPQAAAAFFWKEKRRRRRPATCLGVFERTNRA